MNIDDSVVKYSNNGGDIKTIPKDRIVEKFKGFQKFDVTIGMLNPNVGTQFDGRFSNLNVFEHYKNLNIQEMSSDPCSFDGSYLAWKDIEFDLNGDVKIMNLTSNDVCYSEGIERDRIRLALPLAMRFSKANKSCHLFPEGKMAEYTNKEDIKSLNQLDNIHKCVSYWTPYSGYIN